MSDRPVKRSKGVRMSPELALQWLAYAARRPVDDVRPLVSSMTAGELVALGRMLEKSPLLNPPKHRPVKKLTFVCACGCGQKFTREYTTKRPQYANEAHRLRYWRRRKRFMEGGY